MEKTWIENSLPFLNYIDSWLKGLPETPLESVITSPETTAVISVDVINGFCCTGPLASHRVNNIIDPVVDILQRSWELGVRSIVLTQDSHPMDAVEFNQFPPHCVRGTIEAGTVKEIEDLPFFHDIQIFRKNSIQSGVNAGFNSWLQNHPEMNTFIIVGDCTDLCTYQLAMHIRLHANENQLKRRIVLPVNAVDTYDLSPAAAGEFGAIPHDADLLHAVFLYHMNLNGIEIFSRFS